MFTKSARHIESIMAHALKLNVIELKLPIEVVIDSAIIELYCSYWRKNTSVITSQQGNGRGNSTAKRTSPSESYSSYSILLAGDNLIRLPPLQKFPSYWA
jgi:hypothetical protein